MSTVFHGFKVPKRKLWDLVAEARKYYLANYPLLTEWTISEENIQLFNARRVKFEENNPGKSYFSDGWTLIRELFNEEKHPRMDVRLQLFDSGKDWLCRVLEFGYQWQNEEIGKSLTTPFIVDTRVDDPEDIPRRTYRAMLRRVHKLDTDIDNHKYLIVNIIDGQDAIKMWYNLNKEAARRVRGEENARGTSRRPAEGEQSGRTDGSGE